MQINIVCVPLKTFHPDDSAGLTLLDSAEH